MFSRFIGGILLIVGTSIGAGMLALPVANAATGFWQSSLFLLLIWAIMTLGAFFILEVNLYLPRGTNMVSMAYETLGLPGLIATWITYLLLLYSLLSAYISGGTDVFAGILDYCHINARGPLLIFLFTMCFGLVVYSGIKNVDLLNRVLMLLKIATFFLLTFLLVPYIKPQNFGSGDYTKILGTFTILITSFGYAIIIPSLREYFDDDLAQLKKVIFIGSLIPLICYIFWDAVIMGTIKAKGEGGLNSLLQASDTTSALSAKLAGIVNNDVINTMFHFFTAICMLTAFLGVSLCLISFLSDGLNMRKQGKHGLGLFLLTFTPPFIIVVCYPGAYINALSYAGIFCIILLILLPALMSLVARKKYELRFTVFGGKITQILLILASIILLFQH